MNVLETYVTVFFGALTTVALFAYGTEVSQIITSIGSASASVGQTFLPR